MKSIKDDRIDRSATIPCIRLYSRLCSRFCGMIVFGFLLFSMSGASGFGQAAADPFTINAGPSTPAPPSFNTPAPVPPTPALPPAPAPAVAKPQLPPTPAPAAAKPQVGAPAPLGAPPKTPPLVEVPQKPAPKPANPEKHFADGAKVPPTMQQTALKNYSEARHAMNSSREPSETYLRENPQFIRSVPTPGHPLLGHLDLPAAADSLIKGKPLSIAALLDGVRNPVSRRQLLQAYWEMVGLLAEYNCRRQAEQLAAGGAKDAQFNQTINLLRQQRRAAEVDFVKNQWQFAELLKRHKGVAPTEEQLPIPNEFPLVKKYETHADKIARSERSRYVARVIPIQEQLLHARLMACRETFEIHKTIPPNSSQLLFMLQQRTEAFLEMTEAIVEYNQMIAEYASETIPAGASHYKLVGALVELPKFDPPGPAPRQNQQMAAPDTPKLGMTPSAIPETVSPEEGQKLPEGPESVYAAQPKPIAEEREVPATAFFRGGDDQAPRVPGQRRRGHPDVMPAAFESVAAPPAPIVQTSHVEEPSEPKPLAPPN